MRLMDTAGRTMKRALLSLEARYADQKRKTSFYRGLLEDIADQRENRRLLATLIATGASWTSTRMRAVRMQTAAKLAMQFVLPTRQIVEIPPCTARELTMEGAGVPAGMASLSLSLSLPRRGLISYEEATGV